MSVRTRRLRLVWWWRRNSARICHTFLTVTAYLYLATYVLLPDAGLAYLAIAVAVLALREAWMARRSFRKLLEMELERAMKKDQG